jgi:TolA-binding protein
MTPPTCDRSWQVIAKLDGRLDASAAASFSAHLAGCRACAHELAAHERIARELGEVLPDGATSELEQRRAGNALLKAADARALGRSSFLRWRAALVPAFAGSVALAAVAVQIVKSRPHEEFAARHPEARFELRDEGQARWSKQVEGPVTRIALRDGRANLHVEHLEGGARFLVTLPDGELEVRGTRFEVVVEGEHTRSVRVTEGSVSLDVPTFHGTLRAGERWPAEEVSVPAAGPVAAAEEEPKAPQEAVAARGMQRKRDGVDATEAGQASTAGGRFAEAMAAFTAGDYGRADTLLAGFAHDFPRDARAEDAAYLRAEARMRRGDREGASAAAQEYLRRYPHGLRRRDAERMVPEARGSE